MQPAFRHRSEDSREAPRHPRRLKALGRRVLGEMQLPDAVGKHRRVAGRQVELARIDLGDVSQHDGGGGALPGDVGRQIAQKSGIGQMGPGVGVHGRDPAGAGMLNGLVLRSGLRGGASPLYHAPFRRSQSLGE